MITNMSCIKEHVFFLAIVSPIVMTSYNLMGTPESVESLVHMLSVKQLMLKQLGNIFHIGIHIENQTVLSFVVFESHY